MSDERRKRAEELLDIAHQKWVSQVKFTNDGVVYQIAAMLAFADERVAAERARCAKVCRQKAVSMNIFRCAACTECAEAIARDGK
jgi:ferredoxin